METAESRDFSGPASAQKSTDSRWTPFNDGWRQDEQKILNSAEPVLSTADSTLLLPHLALLRTTRSTAQTFAGSVLLRTCSSPPITLGCVPPSLQTGPVLHSRRALRLSERASASPSGIACPLHTSCRAAADSAPFIPRPDSDYRCLAWPIRSAN